MTSKEANAQSKNIVIIGGGIIGTSTAYYLSRHPFYDPNLHTITLLEASNIAGGASGKGGGFIADWATPKCLAPLSFKLHNDLAKEHDGAKVWGYRNVYAAEVKLLGKNIKSRAAPELVTDGETPQGLDWLRPGSIQKYEEIGTPANSGQVNPYMFTKMLARFAEDKGVTFSIGSSAVHINHDEDGAVVKSVSYKKGEETRTIDVTDVLVAAGPWTPTLLPTVSLLTPRGHSVIVKPTRPFSPYILFPDIEPAPGSSVQNLLSPDIYPRPADKLYPFDTVYASGPDDYEEDLPSTSDKLHLVEQKCADVLTAIGSVSQEMSEGAVVIKQACYKPQIRKHEEDEEVGPMVGPMGIKGLWLATGHDEWGIQNAPGTGLVMSEMIFEGKAHSADCSSMNPRHFIKASASL